MEICENIKAARIKKGYMQKDVAAALGCAVSSVANYESGKINPSMDVLENLCNVLDITPPDLLERHYTFDEIAEIAAKAVSEREYGEQIALNFSRKYLEKLLPKARKQHDKEYTKKGYIINQTGLNAAAVASLTGKNVFTESETQKISPLGLDGLNILLSSSDGLAALENIAAFLNAHKMKLPNGSPSVVLDCGTYSDNYETVSRQVELPPEMLKNVFLAVARKSLEKISDERAVN